MRIIILCVLLISISLSCSTNEKSNNSDNSNQSKLIIDSEIDTGKKKLIMSDDILYNTDIWKIDQEYENDSSNKILEELKLRVLNNGDQKSFDRLVAVGSNLDGDLSECYSRVMGDIFTRDPKYFLLNTYKHKNAEQIYCSVILNNYPKEIESKRYPENYKEIQSYGESSKLFQKVYQIYLEKGF